ncbi:retrovirus-related pol polyprotein from transposon TNT 1-94 [Tanacetum coccineum]|uniref:Retrovirus-related pol polyprotein from transposon TNT 1-94 n=1 Tax=Tanacetum coccineum TaxID=301880 RepID=A0ABQ4YSW7_9ASTR
MGVYQRTSTHSSITYTDDKGIWGIHEEDSGKEHAMVSRLGKLWFKISIEDTMRLIKEDQFRETIQEEWCSRECRSMDEEQSLFLGGEQVTNVDDDVDDSPENDVALNVDHVFEADECDAFDSDVDEGPTTQTMFMANLTSEDSIYDEAGPSYDSNNPCEVQDHDTFVDRMNEYHEVHEMQNDYVEGQRRTCCTMNGRNDSCDSELAEIRNSGQGNMKNGQRVNTSTEASGSKPRSNTKKNRIPPAKTENKKKVEDHPRTNKSVWTKVNRVDSSISSKRVLCECYPTVKIVLNKEKQIWKPKGKLSDNSLNKTKQVWKATGKLFANVGYQWRSTGKKDALGKLNCGYQWRPTGKKFALGELCHLTKLSMQCCIGPSLVSGLRLFKTYDGESFKAQELCGKVHRSVRFGNDHLGAIMGYGDYVILVDSVLSRVYTQHTYFVRDIEGTYILKGSRSTNLYTISIDEMMKSLDMLLSKVPTRSSQQTKNLENTNMEVLHTLHMDLCGPMRVQSIKGKKYILVIVDDYSRFTWVKFLRSKDETPEFVINFLKQIQLGLNKTVRFIRTDNGTEFNRSLIHTRHNKTPYELVHEKKPDLTFFRVFGALCYPTNDSEDLGKFQAKADIGIFVGYAPSRKGYKIYNKRTRRLMETIHVTFDEMHQSMAPVRISSGPEPFIMTHGQLKSGLAPTDKELEMLFQPMFDEHLEQSRVNKPVPSATDIDAQVVPPGTYVSTTIAQDAPSTSASSSTSDIHHPVQHQEMAEEPIHEDTPINHDVLHPSHDLVTGDPGSFGSNIIGNVNSAETQTQIKYIPDQSRRGTKDHPLDNIVWQFPLVLSFAQLLRIEAIRDILCNVQSKEYDHSTRGMSKMSMMGQMSFFLGLQVSQSPRGIFINQAKYALETLKKYGMDLSDPESIHQWWIDGNGRGISWGIFQLTKLDSEEWLAPLCTLQMRIMRDVKIQERSTSGMVSQFLGDRLVSWSSKKQRSMAISTTEAEYIAMSGCCAQILWMRSQVSKQRYEYDFINFSFVCDNKSVLLFAVTTSSTLDQNTSTYVTISSVERSKKIEWLNSTSWKRIISLQTFSPKHYQENGSNFFFHA